MSIPSEVLKQAEQATAAGISLDDLGTLPREVLAAIAQLHNEANPNSPMKTPDFREANLEEVYEEAQ